MRYCWGHFTHTWKLILWSVHCFLLPLYFYVVFGCYFIFMFINCVCVQLFTRKKECIWLNLSWYINMCVVFVFFVQKCTQSFEDANTKSESSEINRKRQSRKIWILQSLSTRSMEQNSITSFSGTVVICTGTLVQFSLGTNLEICLQYAWNLL
jgi:hypothetical protein